MPTLAYARSYGPANGLNQVSSEAGVPLIFNPDDNLSSDGTNVFTFTFGNRLAYVVRTGMTAIYDYDSDDRRTKKTVNNLVTRTMWSGADEMAELDASGNVLRRFVPDGSGAMDGRLATVEANGTVYWHHTDHQGSVIATSNSAGQTVETATYSPHGEFGAGVTTPPQGSPFGYTGRQYDVETGLYQYRARYYSPRLGQFLSVDPIGTKDDPNLYMYIGLDPVNATDPTGKQVAVRLKAVDVTGRDVNLRTSDTFIRIDEAIEGLKDGFGISPISRSSLRTRRRPPGMAQGAVVARRPLGTQRVLRFGSGTLREQRPMSWRVTGCLSPIPLMKPRPDREPSSPC